MSAFDKKKTVTDMEFVSLLEKDVAYRQAKMGIWFSSHSMQQFNESFFYWKKDYRGRYSERYLERMGFDPSTPATSLEVDDDLLLAYIQDSDPDALSILSDKSGLAEPIGIGRFYMQENDYDWTNHTNELVLGDVTYNNYTAEYIGTDETTILLTFTKVEEGLDDVVHEIEINNDFYNAQCLIASYYNDEFVSFSYNVYIELGSTVPWEDISILDEITMSAVVPLKQNDIIERETLELTRMLNRMGLGGSDLMDSLIYDEENDKVSPVDNAYIVEGLPFDTQDDVNATPEIKKSLAKALYRSFDLMSTNNAKTFSIEYLNMSYSFNVEIEDFDTNLEDVSGIPMRRGEYMSILTASTDQTTDATYQGQEYNFNNNSTLELYHKISDTQYKILTVSNYTMNFTISGYSFVSYLDSPEEEGRLIIPLDVLNDLPFRDFVAVHERSFMLLVYAKETYTIKWYQRGIFQFIFLVLITYFTAGVGTSFATVIVNAAINFAISYAIGLVVSMLDNEFLALVFTIALVLVGAYMNGFDFSNFTVENYLPMANKVIDSASSVYSDYVQEQMKKIKEEAEEQAEEDQELLDSMKPGFEVTKAMMDAHFSYIDINGANTWINQMLGENLMNFDQYFNPTAEIELRKQVVSG